jgi:hypothetical protein
MYPSQSYRKIAPLFLHVPVTYPSRVDDQPVIPQGVLDPGVLFDQSFTPSMSSYKHYTYKVEVGATDDCAYKGVASPLVDRPKTRQSRA